MLDFSWKVFSMTGNVDTYLLLKELERDSDEQFGQDDVEQSETFDSPTH
ncbi:MULTISPECIES: YqzL family protein [Halalkalibacter]|nr:MULTISPECIES: YqzL family protein [Halalkalibacter]MCK0471560.1 YqzL family protein [Halalkalibacter sp. APA_J-10(15)]